MDPRTTVEPPSGDLGFGGFGGFGGEHQDPRFGELARAIDSDLALKRGRQLSISVVLDGELAFATGIGANADEHTLYALGSSTELVTAMTMLALVDEGRLSLDHPLDALVRDFAVQPRAALQELTLHRLLTHTSGLGYPVGAERLPIDWRVPDSLGDLYDNAAFPIWSPPGRIFNRQWFGLGLAGHIAEVVTGEYFTAVATNRVLEPLGMYDATYEPLAVAARPHAEGHVGTDETSSIKPLAHPGFVALPTTGLYASAMDLGRLSEALVGGDFAEALRPHVATQNPFYRNRGYGMMVWEDGGMRLAASSDRRDGYGTLLMIAPEHGFAVAVLSNCDWYELTFAAYRAFELFLNKRLTLFNGGQTGRTERASFAGNYVDVHRLGPITVTATDDGLQAEFHDFGHTSPMPQLAENVFWFSMNQTMQNELGYGDTVVTFVEDPIDGSRYFVTNVGVATRQLSQR